MYIYKILKGRECTLNEIPEEYRDEIQVGITDGFIKVRYNHGICYYSLVAPTLIDPGEIDTRDYKYSLLYGATLPRVSYTIKAADNVEWITQGSRNTCAAWTAVECKRILDLQKFPDYYVNSPNKIYTKVTADGSTINDLPKNYFSAENLFQRADGVAEGASPQKVLNAARTYMILEYDQPTTISGSYVYQESIDNVIYYKPTDHKIDGYAACSSFKQIIDALNSDHPVYLCYALTTGYNQITMEQTDEFQDGGIIGYHASACVGYELRHDQIYLKIQQSYEGKYKYNYMSKSYFNKYIKHAWAILDANETKLIQYINDSQNDMNTKPVVQELTIPNISTPQSITKSITQPTILNKTTLKQKISNIIIPKILIPKINIKKK